MTPTPNPPALLAVIQADREAAASIIDGEWGDPKGAERICGGEWDYHHAVQAFARHRLQSTPAEPKVSREAEWETFCDHAYFGLWCVRRKGETAFGQGFHVQSKAEADALLEALSHPPADGDGWRAAPVEPTTAMLNAAVDATGAGSDMSWANLSPQRLFERAWSAMLAAAPPSAPLGAGGSEA